MEGIRLEVFSVAWGRQPEPQTSK